MRSLILAAAVFSASIGFGKSSAPVSLAHLNQLKAPFVLPELSYGYDTLKEVIDTETMTIHHSKHHMAYVDNLNKAQVDSKQSLQALFDTIATQPAAVRNNGGGHWNHAFFWSLLTPDVKQREIPKSLKQEIEASFGSWAVFQDNFEKQGLQQFGSGWVWLIRKADGSLAITSTANQDNPLMKLQQERGIPLLGNDIWEHAYYLKYQNKRAEYLKNFWNIVNWQQVEQYRVESQSLIKQGFFAAK